MSERPHTSATCPLGPLAAAVRTACLLEATARKPGNVHPEASFDDLCWRDFVHSAEVIAPAFDRVGRQGVGRTVLAATEATVRAVGRNTNLGIILLLAPLAAVPAGVRLVDGIETVLAGLTRDDAADAYRAIRAAQPGGMGSFDREDVGREPTVTLREAMALAAERDAIASEYTNGFSLVLKTGLPLLATSTTFPETWERDIIHLQLALMAVQPDTLIARKCGTAVADESARRAGDVLDCGGLDTSAGRTAVAEFDCWLRSDGHRRNPGTTADLVTACLFAALREKAVAPSDDEVLLAPWQSCLK